jgi:hypothetical protein
MPRTNLNFSRSLFEQKDWDTFHPLKPEIISNLVLAKAVTPYFGFITAFSLPKLSRNNSAGASQNELLLEARNFNH